MPACPQDNRMAVQDSLLRAHEKRLKQVQFYPEADQETDKSDKSDMTRSYGANGVLHPSVVGVVFHGFFRQAYEKQKKAIEEEGEEGIRSRTVNCLQHSLYSRRRGLKFAGFGFKPTEEVLWGLRVAVFSPRVLFSSRVVPCVPKHVRVCGTGINHRPP